MWLKDSSFDEDSYVDVPFSFSLNTIEYCWSFLYESFVFFMIVMQYILNTMFVILIILKNIHIIFLLARFCCVVALNGQVSWAHEDLPNLVNIHNTTRIVDYLSVSILETSWKVMKFKKWHVCSFKIKLGCGNGGTLSNKPPLNYELSFSVPLVICITELIFR